MTDISRWPDFIEKVTKHCNKDGWGQESIHDETHIVVPLNEYQVANLLGAFTRMWWENDEGYNSGKNYASWNTGDWFHEIISILAEYCVKMEFKEIQANGLPYVFNIEELESVAWDLGRYNKKKMDELCVKCKGWKKEAGKDICSMCEKHD